jgi:protein-disulfide isomerase
MKCLRNAGLVAVLALAACARPQAPAGAGPQAAGSSAPQREDPNQVVAQWGDQKITLAELDESLQEELTELEREMRDKKFETRKNGLEELIAKRLVGAEATRRGVTEDQVFKAEVDAKAQMPSDEEARALYDAQKDRLPPGAPGFDAMKDRIKEFMAGESKKKLAQEFLARLKADAKVKVALQEPRVAVAAEGPSRGPASAPVTIVTFSDFECPFCSRAIPTLERVMKEYDGKVRLVFRDFPLPFHPNAQKAAEAGDCAAAQGKFWEMHDKMFASQQALQPDQLKGYAKELGLDAAKFDECLDKGAMADAVKKDHEAGREAGVRGTPAFFVNGKLLSGAQPFEEFKAAIDAELAASGT